MKNQNIKSFIYNQHNFNFIKKLEWIRCFQQRRSKLLCIWRQRQDGKFPNEITCRKMILSIYNLASYDLYRIYVS